MKVTKELVRGRERHVLDFGERDGKRRRKYFDTEEQALQAMRAARKDEALAGRWWALRSASEKAEMIAVFRQMAEAGVKPSAVWEAYSSGQGGAVKQSRTLREAITETMLAKRQAGRRERYLVGLERYLKKFALGREDLPIERVTPKDIDAWFAKRKEQGETRLSNLGRLSSLFGLCVRRSYLTYNPCSGSERVSIDRKPPPTFPVEQIARFLNVVRRRAPRVLRYFVLTGLLGLRPDEALGTGPDKIDLRLKRVTIDFQSSKIRSWRIVPLPGNVVAWLKLTVHQKGLISRQVVDRTRRRLMPRVGIARWPQDVLRHTAASHLLAYHDGDEAKVAALLGTSPRELHKKYKSLLPKEAGRKFMSLKP